jgi:hypothetical protein
LGSGRYGKVYNAFHEKEYKNGKRYACKVIELVSQLSTQTGSGKKDNSGSNEINEEKKVKDEIKLKRLKEAENQYLKK